MNKYPIKKSGVDFIFVDEEPIMKGMRKKKAAICDNKFAMFKYEIEDRTCSEACSEKLVYEIAKK